MIVTTLLLPKQVPPGKAETVTGGLFGLGRWVVMGTVDEMGACVVMGTKLEEGPEVTV